MLPARQDVASILEGRLVMTTNRPGPHLRTGHPEMDEEHAMLLAMLERLRGVCPNKHVATCPECGAAQHDDCWVALIQMLARVIGYTVNHFAFEEKAMRRIAEIDSAGHSLSHANDHERITVALRSVMQPLGVSNLKTAGAELETVIRSWLEEHIVRFDVPLAELLRLSEAVAVERGVAEEASRGIERRVAALTDLLAIRLWPQTAAP
jgi:hemerythrin-like metal-binding protein